MYKLELSKYDNAELSDWFNDIKELLPTYFLIKFKLEEKKRQSAINFKSSLYFYIVNFKIFK